MFVYFLSVLPSIVPFNFGDQRIHSGEFIQVYCTVKEGDLPLKVRWYLNGQSVNNYEGITTAPVGKRGTVLSIESVQYEHAGNYCCKAENNAGGAEYTTELQVNGSFEYLLLIIPSH